MSELFKGDRVRYFGDYLLLGEISSGGMGTVYRARQVSLNRTVAVKVIRAGQLANENDVRRFRTEAEAAGNLVHPNIVPIYEVGEHEGNQYFSMRLIEGSNLAEALQSSPMEPRRAVELLIKLARAVHFAHQHGVLHRDIKPANILLDELGEPHLMDFGVAKLLDREAGHTLTGVVLGTPSYMAPEQAAGKTRLLTTAGDTYSLGVMLYEMLTGRLPFAGESSAAILKQVQEQEPAPPRSIRPQIPVDLETICLKCLEKEPMRRYASAEALAQDLERWLRGEPIQARPIGVLERSWKWACRHPVVSGLIGALALSVVLGLAGVTWQWRRAENQRSRTVDVSARLQLQRAQDLFNSGNAPLALATLARHLRDTPTHRATAERLVNALNQRRFLIPATQSTNTPSSPSSLHTSTDLQRTFRLARSADGQRLATATNGATIGLWNARTGLFLGVFAPPHSNVIRSIAFSHANDRLTSASADGTAKIWDVETRKLLATLPHVASVHFAEFSPNDALVVTACRDGIVRLWETESGRLLDNSMPHGDSVNIVRFSADGRVLASGGDDGVVRVWSVSDSQLIAEPLTLSSSVEALHFSTNGLDLAIRLAGGEVSWFTATAVGIVSATGGPRLPSPSLEPIAIVLGLAATNFHRGEITCTNFSRDGLLLATAATDQSARLWNVHTREPITDPLLHSASVNWIVFSPDGLRVATSASDHRIRVWDVATGQPLTDWITCGAPVTGVAFSEDGTRVIASTGEAWSIHAASGAAPKWLPELAEAIAGLRINEARLTERVPVREWNQLRVKLALEQDTPALAGWAKRLVRVH